MASVYEAWINFKGDIQHHLSCDLMKSSISPGYTGNQEKCTCGGWELMTAIEATEAAESRLAALEDVARAAQAVYNALEDGSLGARKELVVSLEQALSRAREAGFRLEEHIVDTNKMMPAPPGAEAEEKCCNRGCTYCVRPAGAEDGVGSNDRD